MLDVILWLISFIGSYFICVKLFKFEKEETLMYLGCFSAGYWARYLMIL
jgi:hypothetical protein